MKSLYHRFKAWRRVPQAVTGMAPSPRTPPRGRPAGGLTDTDYLRLLISTRAWP
jgi:hypothetical protein